MNYNLKKIKLNLRRGDYKKIAETTGLSKNLVYKVFAGTRVNLKIISAAQDLAIANMDDNESIRRKSKKIREHA